VQTADGRLLGAVNELLVDVSSLEVTYLEVAPAGDASQARGLDFSHVPIDGVDIDSEAKVVVIPWLATRSRTAADAHAAPEAPAAATRRVEARPVAEHPRHVARPSSREVQRAPVAEPAPPRVVQQPAGDVANNEPLRVQRAEEVLDVGTRRVNAGRIGIRKRVETEHVTQPVTTQRNEVTMERRPVDADQTRATQPSVNQGEIRIPVVEEQIVVEKRPIVKEEIVIRTNQVTETQRIEADVRKERVDVDRQDSTTRRVRDVSEDDRRSP